MNFQSPEAVLRHAIRLAGLKLGCVEPNPPVGAVIVDQSLNLLGQGCHQTFGGPHAEILALNEAGERARGATLYCTLEPCSHFGKTPPCADAIIAAGIAQVVVGTTDPAPHVNGRGIQKLREAGITVQVGLCERECQRLIAPFRKLMLDGLPWVHAKWAMSLDGRIATSSGDSKWITNEQARAKAHELRGRCDAILVGSGTVLVDDPLLTARPIGPRVAVRVILDSLARIPLESQLVRTARDIPTLVVVSKAAPATRLSQLRSLGVETLSIESDPITETRPSLHAVLRELGRRKMTHVLIEGGAGLLGAAFDQNVIDEFHVMLAPVVIGGVAALSPVGGHGTVKMAEVVRLSSVSFQQLGDNVYLHGDRPAR